MVSNFGGKPVEKKNHVYFIPTDFLLKFDTRRR